MNNLIDIIKGIHPGKFIERELKKKHLTQRALADETGIPFQTINAIIAGRRSLTTKQALKIDQILGYEEGFFAILQTHYDIKQYKDKDLASIYTEAPPTFANLYFGILISIKLIGLNIKMQLSNVFLKEEAKTK